MQYPDSPEGVAFALMMLIVGASDQKLPSERDACESETLALYRRCLGAVTGESAPFVFEGVSERVH